MMSGLAGSAGALAPDETNAVVDTTAGSSVEASPAAGDGDEGLGETGSSYVGDADEAEALDLEAPDVMAPDAEAPEAEAPEPKPEPEPAPETPSVESSDSPATSRQDTAGSPGATAEPDASAGTREVTPLPASVAAPTTESSAPGESFVHRRVTVRLARLPRSKVASTAVTVTRVRTTPAVAVGTPIRVQKRKGTGRWRLETTTTADAAGRARVELTPGPGRWRIRAVVMTGPRFRSNVRTLHVTRTRPLQISGPRRIDGGADVTLRASFARPVEVPLTLQKKRAGASKWRPVATRTATVTRHGDARVRFGVTADRAGTWVYRVVKRAGAGGPRSVSATHRMRSLRPGPPPFAWSVSPVREEQVRYSHRAGCPVAVSQLRNLNVRYVDYGGSVRTGTVVLRADSVDDVRMVFERAYEQRFPFKVVRPLEAYYAGGARSPHDSDVAAMNAGNTGAFNCRPVVGNPYRTSQHSYGNAIDYNTIQNPYVTASRVYPSAGVQYLDRSRYRTGMILPGSVVASTMASRGWPWGARWAYPDYQHFSSNGG